MSFVSDINSIIKIKKIRQPLPTLNEQSDTESFRASSAVETTETGVGLVPPLTIEILTYDDTQDVLLEANNGDFTIKTAATALITDAEGTELEVDTIIYADPA